MDLTQAGLANEIHVGPNTKLTGSIVGNNNRIEIEGSTWPASIRVNVRGNNNSIRIGKLFATHGLHIVVGSHVPAHQTRVNIGKNFSIEPNGKFLLYTSGNRLEIGDNCMFSSNIIVRCGECPHLVFDKDTGAYLDQSEGVFIGDHVWVGEKAYLTKGTSVGNECIVGACSVVTKRFTEEHVAIAGNPASIVRRGVQWIRNPGLLEEGSKYKDSFDAYHSQFS